MEPHPFKNQGSVKTASSQGATRYYIKKALVNQHKGRCADCYRRTVPVRMVRVWRKKESPKGEPYILLCSECIIKRRKKEKEKRKKQRKRLWEYKPKKSRKGKNSKTGFFNRIRKKVLERDNYTCVWCGAKEKQKLGLGSLVPLSRGGKLEFDNFVCACWHCRPSKGDMLPLEYLWKEIDLDEYLNEELDEHLRVKSDPGKNTSIQFALLAEISEFLHKLTNSKAIPGKVCTRAERLNIKLLS